MFRRKRYRGAGHVDLSVKILSILGVVVILSLFGGAGYIYVGEKKAREELDPSTFCRSGKPESVTVVLVDRTDGVNEVQAAALRALMPKWVREVPTNGAFRIYEVTGGDRLPEPVLSVCNPGSWDEANKFTSNKRITQERYEAMFIDPINELLAGMLTDKKADVSPIMEAVQAIAVREFAPLEPGSDRRLYIVSDLMQFTPGLNLYKSTPDIDTFAQSPYARRLESHLDDVKTWIFRLNSESPKQNEATRLWLDWLLFQKADLQERTTVDG